MNIFTFICFVIQVSVASGRLTVLRGKEIESEYSPKHIKLLCASEDDGSSLIWNPNMNPVLSGNSEFQPLNVHQKGEIDCHFNPHDNCSLKWSTVGWSLVNSKTRPMGPVFDRRWEGWIYKLSNDERLKRDRR